jgi:NDP-sugar pyrophosphorylase family protein
MDNFKTEKFFDLSTFAYRDIFNEINYVWEVLPKIKEYIVMQFKSGQLKANYKEKDDVYIGEGTIIQEGVTIVGPAIIGRYALLGHGSYVRENCIIGNNAQLGHAVEVKGSIFLDDSKASHLNYIGDSIIGGKVNISGGAILANYRLDKKPIMVIAGENKIETGLEKFGSIIGDRSNIGVSCVLNPGTILGKNTVIYPLISVKGVHKDNEVIK